MYLYVGGCIIQSFFGTLHLTYLAIFWNEDSVTYNAYYMYITGSLAILLLLTVSLSVSFLSIDRIFIALFPTKYTISMRNAVAMAALATIILADSVFIIFDFAVDFPVSAETHCRAQTCLKVISQAWLYTNARYCVAAINVIAGIILGVILKQHIPGNSQALRANRVIFITIVLAFVFDFLPHLAINIVSYICKMMSNGKEDSHKREIRDIEIFYSVSLIRFLQHGLAWIACFAQLLQKSIPCETLLQKPDQGYRKNASKIPRSGNQESGSHIFLLTDCLNKANFSSSF